MPNGESKKLNFTLKILDPVSKTYRPVYIAPDATDAVQGDVKLSDAVNSTLDAASGMTAATPKAVKMVQDSANNKLDKTSSADQTVTSKVTFNNAIVCSKGITIPDGQVLNGDVNGNATTATTLATSRQISVKVGNATAGSANFNGGADATITVPQVDASVVTTGTLPLSVLPQGALERLIKVENQEARFALTTGDVQLGDSVLQIDTDTMYIVVDVDHLGDATGYEEYAAGTAVLAETAEKVANALTVQKNGATQFTYDGSSAQTINIASSFADLSGQIAYDQIPDSIIDNEKLGITYAGSESKGGSATSAVKLETARTISLTGVINGSITFDGTADATIQTSIPDQAIIEDMIADDNVTTVKISDSAVTEAKIADGAITTDKIAAGTIENVNIADATITGDKLVSGTITGTQLADDSITSANIVDGSIVAVDIADGAITDAKLSSDVGTVAVQTDEPTSDNVKIWIKI